MLFGGQQILEKNVFVPKNEKLAKNVPVQNLVNWLIRYSNILIIGTKKAILVAQKNLIVMVLSQHYRYRH